MAVGLPTALPQALPTRPTSGLPERLTSTTFFLATALIAFGLAAVFILIAAYIWRREW